MPNLQPLIPCFSRCTFEHPFISAFSPTLLLKRSSRAHIPKIQISLPSCCCQWDAAHAGGRSALHAGSSCFDRPCWRISLRPEAAAVLADAAGASHAALAAPVTRRHRPSLAPPSLSPSEPRPESILSGERSPCQIAWWFSDVNRWD